MTQTDRQQQSECIAFMDRLSQVLDGQQPHIAIAAAMQASMIYALHQADRYGGARMFIAPTYKLVHEEDDLRKVRQLVDMSVPRPT